MLRNEIDCVRRLNRAVTRETGALDESFLGRGRSLGAARVLCCIGAAGCDVAKIRSELGLDSGLMSRLLRALEAGGLIAVTPDAGDGRRRIARPTATVWPRSPNTSACRTTAPRRFSGGTDRAPAPRCSRPWSASPAC
jgi:hypothetical protein